MPIILHKTKSKTKPVNQVYCHHCGDTCPHGHPKDDDLHFCCTGCQAVYSILHENGLGQFYSIYNASLKPVGPSREKYLALENEEIVNTLISFSRGDVKTIFLELPDIHCSACIWLLENINKIESGIMHSQVDFLKKKCTLVFNSKEVSLREIALLLSKIGYPPRITYRDQAKSKKVSSNLASKIAVAGFCFGNIMLFSFPDYLGMGHDFFTSKFGILNLILSIPVLVYSARDYFIDAYRSIVHWQIGIEIPIALGATALFVRSVYEITSGTGMGYMDSFTGFILFLLIGKWFQEYTYQYISFDRDYRDFLPMTIDKKINASWYATPIDQIIEDDIVLIRMGEIIPCDGIIQNGSTSIDYSFITGETTPLQAHNSDPVSAGGKNISRNIEVKVTKPINQSGLSALWEADVFSESVQPVSLQLLNKIGTHFTQAILLIAALTLGYWMLVDPSKAILSFTAVLIIACPCVLALSFPFIYGNSIRLFSKAGIFVKNAHTFFTLQHIDTIVFDKTGTLTETEKTDAIFHGDPLSDTQASLIRSTVYYSNHPLSQAISKSLSAYPIQSLDHCQEHLGQGLSSAFGRHTLMIGSSKLILDHSDDIPTRHVIVKMDGKVLGYFSFEHKWRPGLEEMISRLSKTVDLVVLSGDQISNRAKTASLFPKESEILFEQSPKQKLSFIKQLQQKGHKTLMIGDGLNDAGAFKQSNVSMVISKNNQHFTPAADIILSSAQFSRIPKLINASKRLKWVLYGAFILALLYNSIGLYFATQALLTPVVAAILMPISSITIVLYGLILSYVIYVFFRDD